MSGISNFLFNLPLDLYRLAVETGSGKDDAATQACVSYQYIFGSPLINEVLEKVLLNLHTT